MFVACVLPATFGYSDEVCPANAHCLVDGHVDARPEVQGIDEGFPGLAVLYFLGTGHCGLLLPLILGVRHHR